MPQAIADLTHLHDYIAPRAGSAVATGYVERLYRFCQRLETFPARGTVREDIRPGLRTVGFERRATVAFKIDGDEVRIVRVLYGGRDVEAQLGPSTAESDPS
jgi:toxin ParE1/3/4